VKTNINSSGCMMVRITNMRAFLRTMAASRASNARNAWRYAARGERS
jgi:hypothetical protein